MARLALLWVVALLMLLILTELSVKSPSNLEDQPNKIQSLEDAQQKSDDVNVMALSDFLLKGKSESHLNLDSNFSPALKKFLEASKKAGHDIDIYSGYRTYDHQKRLFDEALKKYGSVEKARKFVAPPGKSKHNYGLAADLKYDSKEAERWAHENANKYGLYYRMAHEPWQIELMETKSDKPNETNEKASEVMDEQTKEEQTESPFSSYMMKDMPYQDTRVTLVQSEEPTLNSVASNTADVMTVADNTTDDWKNKTFTKMLGL